MTRGALLGLVLLSCGGEAFESEREDLARAGSSSSAGGTVQSGGHPGAGGEASPSGKGGGQTGAGGRSSSSTGGTVQSGGHPGAGGAGGELEPDGGACELEQCPACVLGERCCVTSTICGCRVVTLACAM